MKLNYFLFSIVMSNKYKKKIGIIGGSKKIDNQYLINSI